MSLFSCVTLAILIVFKFLNCAAVTNNVKDPLFELPHRGCYYTNWAQYRPGIASFKPANIDASLCTYISLAFAKIAGNQLVPLEWNDEDTLGKLVSLKAINANLKIFVSVGGWTLTKLLVEMSGSADGRATFISSVVKNLRKWNLDGLDVDWEFPHAADKATYSKLLTELRSAFEKEASETGNVRLVLTAAVHLLSDGGFDGLIINKTLDIVNVMTYDLAGAWDLDKVGHQAPLRKGPFGNDSALNVISIMEEWATSGIEKSKLVVGLPLYGRGWLLSTAKPSRHDIGAPVTAPIPTSAYTGEAGSWPFFEICQRIVTGQATSVFDESIQGAYAFTETWWIGYDDRQTIAAKTKWALENGFGGVYAWDLAQDDFQNVCGLGKNPLLNAIKDVSTAVKTAVISTSTTLSPTSTSRQSDATNGLLLTTGSSVNLATTKKTVNVPKKQQCVPFY